MMIIFLIIIALIAAYLFLIRPAKAPADARLLCDYAHRGLHDEALPENSMAAFEAACSAGVGIELDIQLSRDGEVMVFHDYTLERMTGTSSKLCELDAAALAGLRLGGTEQTIPRFADVLAMVDGRVPILVELKGESMDASLCQKAAKLLGGYRGAYCIESFNPLLVSQMKKQLPHAFCGLLYTNVCRAKGKITPLNVALTLMLTNVLARPHFIAFDQAERRSLPVLLTTKLFGAARFVWTVRTSEERSAAREAGECAIFEGEAQNGAARAVK